MGENVGCELGSGAAESVQKDDSVRVRVTWLGIDNVERWERHVG